MFKKQANQIDDFIIKGADAIILNPVIGSLSDRLYKKQIKQEFLFLPVI